MDLSPNQLVLLLKVRRVYMMDNFLKNGFKSRHELAVHVDNSFNPTRTTRDFIIDLMNFRILFVQGSLKLDLDLCDKVVKDSPHYVLVKSFIAENYNLIGKSFFE